MERCIRLSIAIVSWLLAQAYITGNCDNHAGRLLVDLQKEFISMFSHHLVEPGDSKTSWLIILTQNAAQLASRCSYYQGHHHAMQAVSCGCCFTGNGGSKLFRALCA
jgi:DNA-binding helix-hairpin-helix protein with protein kinase domain